MARHDQIRLAGLWVFNAPGAAVYDALFLAAWLLSAIVGAIYQVPTMTITFYRP